MDLGVNLNAARNLKLGELAEGLSIRFERGSGVYTGPGYLAVTTIGSATVDGMYATKTFRALWVKTGTVLRYATDPDSGTFYDTGLTLTTATDTWFQEGGDGDLFVFNQTDTPVRIAIATITSAITAASTEITVGADYIGKFAASGTVLINGDSIAYTGVNATQLTGVTGIQAGGHAVNSIIIQTSNPSTWVEEQGLFSFELESRFCIGGEVGFENQLSASAPATDANVAYFYDFDANGTVVHFYPHNLTAGMSSMGRAFVFGESAAWQVTGFDLSTGGFLTNQISSSAGAYNPRCVADVDGTVVCFGNGRVMPISIKISSDTEVPSLNEAFDERLRPWLDNLQSHGDQSRAYLSYDPVQKLLKVGGMVQGGGLETRVFDIQNGSPVGYEIRPGSASAMFDGKRYFGGTTGGIYRDDYLRTNNAIGITHQWRTGRMEYDRGRRPMQFITVEYDGFMSTACEHTLRAYIDGSSEASFDEDYTDSLITSSSGTALGSRGVGTGLLGGDAEVSVFPYKNTVLLVGLFGEDIQLEWEVLKDGAYLQVNNMRVVADVLRLSDRTFT